MQSYMRPGFLLMDMVLPGLIWQEYVCRQHQEDKGSNTHDWAPHLPDLIPKDCLTNIIFLYILHRQVAPQTVEKLSDGLQILETTQDTILFSLGACRNVVSRAYKHKLLSTIFSCCN